MPDAAEPAQSSVRGAHAASRASGRSWRSFIVACSTASETPRVVDLLLHLPSGAIDRRARPKLRDVVPDTVVTVAVTVDRHRPPPPRRPRAPYQVYTSDETGDLILTFFNAHKDYLQRLLPVGEQRYVSGTVALYDHMLQMVHPDRVVTEAELAKLAAGRAGLSADRGAEPQPGAQSGRRARSNAYPICRNGRTPTWVARERFPPFAEALRTLHRPAEPADVAARGPCLVAARL